MLIQMIIMGPYASFTKGIGGSGDWGGGVYAGLGAIAESTAVDTDTDECSAVQGRQSVTICSNSPPTRRVLSVFHNSRPVAIALQFLKFMRSKPLHCGSWPPVSTCCRNLKNNISSYPVIVFQEAGSYISFGKRHC